MPTILQLYGWRLYFYSNEMKEPPHIHCRKGGMECKYWLNKKSFDISEAYSYGLSPKARREIRKIIFTHFDYLITEWNKFKTDK